MYQLDVLIAAGAPQTVAVTTYYPATWWQHLKRAVALNMRDRGLLPLTRRLGARLDDRVKETSTSESREVFSKFCPHLETPEHRRHVTWLETVPRPYYR